MPFYPRRRAYRKKKVGRKARSGLAMRKRVYRSKKYHIFSETFKASPARIQSDGSGATPAIAQFYTASIDSVSQYSAYKALYEKYRILKLEWSFIPMFMGAEVNQAEANVGVGGNENTNNWMHYHRSWNPDTASYPTSELDMLQLNGVRTLCLNGQRKPIKISMKYPAPQILLAETADPTTLGVSVTKNGWLAFDDTLKPDHGGLFTYVVNRSQGAVQQQNAIACDVYCKVTFAVTDPR